MIDLERIESRATTYIKGICVRRMRTLIPMRWEMWIWREPGAGDDAGDPTHIMHIEFDEVYKRWSMRLDHHAFAAEHVGKAQHRNGTWRSRFSVVKKALEQLKAADAAQRLCAGNG